MIHSSGENARNEISKYKRIKLNHPDIVDSTLSRSIGRIGEVNKKRTLYLKESTRFYVDEVFSLGNFIKNCIVKNSLTCFCLD